MMTQQADVARGIIGSSAEIRDCGALVKALSSGAAGRPGSWMMPLAYDDGSTRAIPCEDASGVEPCPRVRLTTPDVGP
jgi:hypothetical protein